MKKIKFKNYEHLDPKIVELYDDLSDENYYKSSTHYDRATGIKSITDEDWENFNPEVKKNKRYVDEWLRDIVKPNKSSQTYKQYKSCIRQFAFWNEKENDGISYAKIKKRGFLRYQNYLLETGMSKKTLELKRNAVSSFCNFLEIYISEEDDSYESFRNFVKGTEIPQGKEKVYEKKPVTIDEFEKVNDILLKSKNYRLYAIWNCLFYTGKRITEVLQLKVDDIKDIPDGKSYILSSPVRGKGKGKIGKILEIRLNKKCIEALKIYLNVRPKNDNPYLFFSGKENHIHQDIVRNEFSTLISTILGRRINPHLLRGSFATYLLNSGISLTTVQQLLSHESVDTTNKFYDLRDKDQLVDKELEELKL